MGAESVFRSGSLHASAGVQVNHLLTIQVYQRPGMEARGRFHISASPVTTKYQLHAASVSNSVVGNAGTELCA